MIERRRENTVAVVIIACLIAGLAAYAIYKGQDGVFFGSAVGGLGFCAGLILPNPFHKKKP